jgi:predicted phosphate transport protein (TIGR00153 family)
MFNQASDNIIEASSAFEKFINAPTLDERKSLGVTIKSIEKKGDDITNKIFDELHKTFITPFDREDIHELATALDDVLDLIYSVSSKIELYHCSNISSYMKEMVAQINLGCFQIQIAVKGLETLNKDNQAKKSCKEINKIESRVDEYYHKGISSLFENEKDPIELIKQKEILQNIEKIANKIEDISDVVRTIVVKYA